MPYGTIEDLPDSVRDHLSEHAQETYMAAFNAAWERSAETQDRRDAAAREETAHRVAWGAVKQAYAEDAEGRWQELG